MSNRTIKRREITLEAANQLSRLLKLPYIGEEWAMCAADHSRIEEFLNAYESQSLNDDERFALMAVILDSYDQLHAGVEERDHIWNRIRRPLWEGFELHEFTIEMNSCLDADDVVPSRSLPQRLQAIFEERFGTDRTKWPRSPQMILQDRRCPRGRKALGLWITDNRNGYSVEWSHMSGRRSERHFNTVDAAMRWAEHEFGTTPNDWMEVNIGGAFWRGRKGGRAGQA